MKGWERGRERKGGGGKADWKLGRIFVFVGWRQILVTEPCGLFHVHTDADTCTNLIWYGTCSPGRFCSAGILLFSPLSPSSPAGSYSRCLTCSFSVIFFFSLLLPDTQLHPLSCSTNTSVKQSLEVRCVLIPLPPSHKVLILLVFSLFDLVGSQPENVFLDGFLAEAMLGELWPAFFTCQLFSSRLFKKKTKNKKNQYIPGFPTSSESPVPQ